MREPNFSFPNQNRAAICITSSIYDRRALDCTDYIPMINTLTNLAYLTGSTPTIRDFITRDGGLERLVWILKYTKVNDRKNGLKWTLAFQCVVNIGVRGTEHIRKRVVQAGMVPVIVNVLESFFTVLKSVSDENERRRRAIAAQQHSQTLITTTEGVTNTLTEPLIDDDTSTLSTSMTASSLATASSLNTMPNAPMPSTTFYNHTPLNNAQGSSIMPEPSPSRSLSENPRPIPGDAGEPRPQQFFYREDDILHALQLLAYLSKYPSLRSSFHTDSGSNVFAIVEKFTHRNMHPLEIQYWAGVIMRNACRKDDTRKGIRQCAYTGCGKWETKPREFAKCRRCRKAKYCSKGCQSKAWNEGHRWWCLEKRNDSTGMSSSFGTDLPPAPPPPPPPPADLQDQPDAGPSLMENGGISSMASGAAGARMIGGGEGGSSTGRHVGTQHLLHHHYHFHNHQQHGMPSSSSSSSSSPLSGLSQTSRRVQTPTVSAPSIHAPSPAPAAAPVPVVRTPTPGLAPSPHGPFWSQEHLLQRQQLVLPQQPQLPSVSAQSGPQQPPFSYNQSNLQHMQMYQQQQQRQRHEQRAPQASHQHPHEHQQARPLPARPVAASPSSLNPMAQAHRSMGHLHPSTTPLRPTPRSEFVPHLGISPDSPTPEQLAQRFVHQVALHPGQHNELAKRLHAQFQEYFPPHHQAEAKRQFSVHAREHFARYQRQQELLKNSGVEAGRGHPNGHITVPGAASGSSMAPHQPLACSSRVGAVGSQPESDISKQGTARRRSDLDSDDEDLSRLQAGSSSVSASISMPMLTQDLTTSMSLSSTELSGPLPNTFMGARPLDGSAYGPSSSAAAFNHGPGVSGVEEDSPRDFKIRKLMREDSSSQSASSSGLAGQETARHRDEWSYSRHMAKDGSVNP
ncbi:hypothetical protein BGX34_003114 [Mortierella sp. NVP85]|nr:hypothetical protein BGX34_003114 [Mortierella sp. NVP85]